ncbi:ABC transporter permease [Microbacterium sp. CJ77]|uniref:ABC transporter permease n=1 Tax=Microbacterium sp. CJ77 TaxID=2079201 RepID=UPI000CD86BCC|nr:polyketide antibiotic transporter [Microbacterium sp. CJ77]
MNGIGALLAQRIRRDRPQVAMWTIGTALLAFFAYVGVAESYGTTQDRTSLLAAAVANPVILLFRGLPSGADEGAFITFLILPWLCLLAAFMSSFLAVRHTRGDEEARRAEMLAATPASRFAPVVATIIHGTLSNVLLAVFVAVGFIAAGLGPTGSILAGAATGSVGFVFLGVGLGASQLFRTSRAANAVSVWTLLALFLAAGIGNALGTPSDDLQRIDSSALTWLSPFGWAENTRPFAENNALPLALAAAVALTLIAGAVLAQSARDLGESFIAERAGRVEASGALSTPIALAWRLSRGAVVGWAVGGLVVGALSTSLASIVAEVGSTNPTVEAMLEQIAGAGNIEQGTVTIFFTMLGVLAACAAVQTVCRARQEESQGTAEMLLATPVHRVRWLAGYLLIGFVAIVAVVGAGAIGAALGIGGQAVNGEGGDFALMRDVAVVGGGQIAAASVFLVVTALIFVALPRATIALGWTLVLLGMVLGLFGPLFGFPAWLTDLSPVGIAPLIEGDTVDARGLWWLLGATTVGAVGSLGLMRRRELATGG